MLRRRAPGHFVRTCRRVGRAISRDRQLRQPEIENFGASPLGHENVRRLNVTMDDALGVRGF